MSRGGTAEGGVKGTPPVSPPATGGINGGNDRIVGGAGVVAGAAGAGAGGAGRLCWAAALDAASSALIKISERILAFLTPF